MSFPKRQPETDEIRAQSAAAKLLHPEDISVGDEVALAIESYDYPSFCWHMADPTTMPPTETIRLNFIPHEVCKPLKVAAVCLPFVLCEKVDGKLVTFDVRKVQLMRLAPEFADIARMGYASKKRRKALEVQKAAIDDASEVGPSENRSKDEESQFALAPSITVDVSTEVVLFEFAVQVPLTNSKDVGGFFTVVVSQS